MEHLYVLTKNFEQFKYFCFINGLNPNSHFVHYITEGGRTLQGTRGARVVYYGMYHECKDYVEIASMIRQREMVDVTGEYVNEVSKY